MQNQISETFSMTVNLCYFSCGDLKRYFSISQSSQQTFTMNIQFYTM